MAELVPCVLTKVSKNPNNLRTVEVKGHCQEEPVMGKRFTMLSDPLTPGATVRIVSTSPIKNLTKIETVNSQVIYDIETLNSFYRIELYK